MKNILSIFAVTILLSIQILFSGCKKDPVLPENTVQQLSFHIHDKVGNQAADYSTTFNDLAGRKLILSDFRYYLSNIVLIKNDGSEFPLTNVVLLVSPTEQDYMLAEVPVGDYKGFKMLYGLDSVTNHQDPATYPAGSPLAIQSPGMHWDWNSGYIFSKIEGLCDTSLAGDGQADFQFFYHVGMDMMKRTVDMSNHPFSVKAGSDKELVLELDLLDILANVDLRTENETHTFNNMPLAEKIADNFSTSFTVE